MPSLLGEPPRSPYDMRFSLANIPVRVSPAFWITAILLGLGGSGRFLILFIAAMFVSVLIHELGHALVMRWCGQSPRIVLKFLGGLAVVDRPMYATVDYDDELSTRQNILILLAGPGAGFLLAAAVAAIAFFVDAQFNFELPATLWVDLSGLLSADRSNLESVAWLSDGLNVLLMVNIYWGLLNLTPIYPLDGGQIARELLTLRAPMQGVIRSLWLSIATAGLITFLALIFGRLFLAIMFGLLAYNNYQTLQGMQGGGGGSWNDGYKQPW